MTKLSDKLVAVIMVKNEGERIAQTSFPSMAKIKHWIVFDTGSTDNTIEVFQTFCASHNIRLDLKQGEFVNFCISRNVLLDYAEELLQGQDKYLVLYDAHDELQDPESLSAFVDSYSGPCSGFYLTQKWWSGYTLDSYYNVRMIRTHHHWRFKGVVHEFIMTPELEIEKKPENEVVFRVEGIYMYQDRTKDDTKSFKRFKRDKELLFAEFMKDPHEPRTLFYLAQTCGCLGLHDEAYKFYLLRIKELGFYEEIYQALFRLGEISYILKHDWEESMTWFLKAFQHSQRAEPLVKIAKYYQDNNLNKEGKSEWATCYMYANMAAQLIYPVNQILFVNKRDYTYMRWHILGMSAYYVGRYKEGKEACLKALETEDNEIDRGNLRFYLEKEIDILQGGKLNCPTLVAVTFADKEVRVKDEMDVKHDRNIIAQEVIDKILAQREQEAKAIPKSTIEALRRNNTSNAQPQPYTSSSQTLLTNAAGATDTGLAPPEVKLSRKDRRAQLRELLKKKRLEKKAKKV